jgi:S1-C subfamily serine protease
MSSSREEITLALQEMLNLPQATGVYVRSVVPGGPSDQGGLRGDSAGQGSPSLQGDGDLIVGVDGQEVRNFSELMSYLINHTRPGQVITLSVLREAQPLDLNVTLGERP